MCEMEPTGMEIVWVCGKSKGDMGKKHSMGIEGDYERERDVENGGHICGEGNMGKGNVEVRTRKSVVEMWKPWEWNGKEE